MLVSDFFCQASSIMKSVTRKMEFIMKIKKKIITTITLLMLSFLIALKQRNNETDQKDSSPQFISLSDTAVTTYNYVAGMHSYGSRDVKQFKVGNGKKQSIGFMGYNIEPYLKNNDEAYNEFMKYKKKHITRWVIYSASAISFIIGISTVNKPTGETTWDPIENKRIKKYESRPSGLILMGAGLIGGIVGTLYPRGSDYYVVKAVRIYNRDLKEKEKSHSFNYYISPTVYKNGAGVGIAFNW